MCLQRQRVRFAQQKGNGSIMRWTDGDMVVLVPAFSSSRGSRPVRPLEAGAKDATASRRVSDDTYVHGAADETASNVLIDRRKETCDAEME